MTHPLDVLKTDMQNNQFNHHSTDKLNFSNSIRNIYKTHGVFGYYRGVFPRLYGIVPMRFLYWGVQNTLNQKLLTNNEKLHQRIGKLTFAGIAGATAQTLIDNPIEVLKIRILTNNTNIGAIKIVSDTIKSKSFPGFWITYARNIPFAVCTNIGVHTKVDSTMNEKFMYGACGGLIGSIVSQPMDFIKTFIQKNKTNDSLHKNTYQYFYNIMKTNPKLLWTGGMTRAILGFFNMGIGAIAFHKCKNYLS